MTYLTFHFVFIIPPIIVLAMYFWRKPEHWPARAGGYSLIAIAVIALVYTTAWDNYLVYRGVWGYGADRVLGTIGYVPVEEYLFFLLQPLLAGLWFYWVIRNHREPENFARKARAGGVLVYVFFSALGLVLLNYERGLYMGLILVWAGPVLAGQWAFAGNWIWSVRRLWVQGVMIPTIYLWVADRVAIGLGIWYIEEKYTVGFNPFGLPLEEATFFLVTNLLVVQGLILFLHLGEARQERLVGS